MIAVPVVDLGALVAGGPGAIEGVAREVDTACRDVGFFSVVHHGVDPGLCARVDGLARELFARPEAEKAAAAMAHGGPAWRGWFPLHGELTSGTPDHKEGYYLGREVPADDPRVRAGIPLHGPNIWPAGPPELRERFRRTMLEYLDALEALGQRLTRVISVALGLDADELGGRWFHDPVILLRLFRYPPARSGDPAYGVAEHTDYGFLTLLWQDESGGLEVRTDDGWIGVPPDREAFVCNIGDMLDRLTGGCYRSTPHRVRPPSSTGAAHDRRDRIAVPFFFDPDWDARIDTLPGIEPLDDAATRWDGTSVHGPVGTYGEYLLGKVGRVFPALARTVLDEGVAR